MSGDTERFRVPHQAFHVLKLIVMQWDSGWKAWWCFTACWIPDWLQPYQRGEKKLIQKDNSKICCCWHSLRFNIQVPCQIGAKHIGISEALVCEIYNNIFIFTWKPHFKHTTMSWDVPISVSIMVLSFRQSEQTSHTLDSTAFFTDVRSTALPTCWQVKPDCKIEFKVTIRSLFGNWCIKEVVRLPTKPIKCSIH